MIDVGAFPSGTPISCLPPISDVEIERFDQSTVFVLGANIPAMQLVAIDHNIPLVWPCAVLGYSDEASALIAVLHRIDIDDGAAEIVIASYGLRVTRALICNAQAQCHGLASGGFRELRVRLPRGASKARRRLERHGFVLADSDAGEDILAIASSDFCSLGRGRRQRGGLMQGQPLIDTGETSRPAKSRMH